MIEGVVEIVALTIGVAVWLVFVVILMRLIAGALLWLEDRYTYGKEPSAEERGEYMRQVRLVTDEGQRIFSAEIMKRFREPRLLDHLEKHR